MARAFLVSLALGFTIAACDRVTAPPPGASADLARCNGADLAAREQACDAVLAVEDLSAADRLAALNHRGEAKRLMGDPTGALADFNAALALDASNADAKLGRGAVLLNSGQLDAATPLIASVLQSGAAPARAHLLRGELYLRQSDSAAAITEFTAAIAADRRNSDAYAARAAAKQARGDYDGAGQDFDAALGIDDANVAARVGRCWNRLHRAGDLGASLNDATAALRAAPQNNDGRLCRGLILLRREDWAGARADYDAVLLNEPANAAALFGRGVARREAGERQEGAADIRHAYDFDSHVDEAFERMGVDF